MPTATTTFSNVALGCSLPPYAPHAVSVSLPTWRDNVEYEEGDRRVLDKMVSGYPRFFILPPIQKLTSICEQKYSIHNEKCLLLPSRKTAEHCRSFIEARTEQVLGKKYTARCVEERHGAKSGEDEEQATSTTTGIMSLYIVLFDAGAYGVAREFWQHTGMGVSSRFAERFLSLLELSPSSSSSSSSSSASVPAFGSACLERAGGKMHNRHYSVNKDKGWNYQGPADNNNTTSNANGVGAGNGLGADGSTYLEERYGRNMPLSVAAFAKRALRRRLAGVLIKDGAAGGCAAAEEPACAVGPSSRGVHSVAEGDVYLTPTGMAAIWKAHQCLLGVGPEAKSVCFGFVYTDTLKILQKWGAGCHFFGNGLEGDIDELEEMLRAQRRAGQQRPILALFTEFPSNPLLRSANLPRLRALADEYDFAIVVDETIGSLVNVEVIRYADIVASSLTKIFSGDANVMGGCLVLNPQGKYYKALKEHLDSTFEDDYFDEDAIYLERNSRDFKRRVWHINANAEVICDFLRSHSVAGGNTSPHAVIKQVFYPKYCTPENYESCRKKREAEGEEGGYGGLFSLTFTSRAASEGFFDALPCFKGPSLGTNFTLACPYTILAHYGELDWAAGFGVEAGLVRVSLGMEDKEELLARFEVALRAAEIQAQAQI